ncbi:MAG: hypothetical protein LC798_05365 [Chloroflexi bacterium]|nr:hypothetical protein [Chloroflexota bacterium]
MIGTYVVKPYPRDPHPEAQPALALVAAAGRGRMIVVTDSGDCWEPTGRAATTAVWRRLAERRRRQRTTKGAQGGRIRNGTEPGARAWRTYSAARPGPLMASCGARAWEVHRWAGHTVKLCHDDGATVYPLPPLYGLGPYEAATGFFDFVEWARDWHHVRFDGTLATIAARLWRQSLSAPIVFVDAPGAEPRSALFGGRQEAPAPGCHETMAYFDITAAYPAAMSAEPFGTSLREVDPATWRQHRQGVALATVAVTEPDAGPWNPLPMRLDGERLAYAHGLPPQTGWWPLRELATAADGGHDVVVARCFTAFGLVDLFGPSWLQTVTEGRGLAGAGAALAKAAANSTWGRFAAKSQERDVIRWATDVVTPDAVLASRRVLAVPDRLPSEVTVTVAAETTARVRERVWTEGLRGLAGAIYVDTDGVIAPAGQYPQRWGAGLGDWKVRAELPTLEVHAPQVLRWREPDSDWHYTFSGVAADDAAAVWRSFGRHFRPRPSLAITPTTPITLPPGPVSEVANYREETL